MVKLEIAKVFLCSVLFFVFAAPQVVQDSLTFSSSTGENGEEIVLFHLTTVNMDSE